MKKKYNEKHVTCALAWAEIYRENNSQLDCLAEHIYELREELRQLKKGKQELS